MCQLRPLAEGKHGENKIIKTNDSFKKEGMVKSVKHYTRLNKMTVVFSTGNQ